MTTALVCFVTLSGWLFAAGLAAVLLTRAIDRRDHTTVQRAIPAPRHELHPLPRPTSTGVSHDHRR